MLPESTISSLSLPVPSLVGFFLGALFLPPYIRWLRRRQIGQFIREEGPASHTAKARTPTMGGLCFMASSLVAAGGWLYATGLLTLPAVAVITGALVCGAIGIVDDVAKLRRKANAGLSARVRLALETAVGLTLGAVLVAAGSGTAVLLPALPGLDWGTTSPSAFSLPLPLFLLVSGFFVAATTNAVNLHDGMDGLAAGTSAQVLATMGVVLIATGQPALAAIAGAGAGSVAAFLLYNRYPASIFMGDTGSLFVGGLMAALCLAGGIEIWFVPLALIYIVETLSVMAQVVYFKLTKEYLPESRIAAWKVVWRKLTTRLPGEGKRLFRMAPLHHHFEAVGAERGVSEWKVVLCFWLAQLLICALVLALLPIA